MKSFFSPWGIATGVLLLIPYIFLEKQWDFAASFISITIAAFIIAGIVVKCIKKVKGGTKFRSGQK